MKRKIMTCFCACVLLALCITKINTLRAADQYSDWDTGSWHIQEESGETVLCAPDGNVHSSIITCDNRTENQLSLSVSIVSQTATIDGNFGVLYQCTNGVMYFFEYNIVHNILQLRRLGTDGSDQHLVTAIPFSVPLNEWFDYKIIIADNLLEWYINDQLKFSKDISNSGDDLSQGKYIVQGYFCAPKVKNIKLKTFKEDDDMLSKWNLGSWTLNTKNGESIITAPDNNVHSFIKTKEASDNNQINFTASIASQTATVDGNFGVAYQCINGVQYFFEYNIVYDILRIRRFGTDGSDQHLVTAASFSVPLNEWFDYEIIAENTCLKWYINGELKFNVPLTNTTELSQGGFLIQGYFCSPKVRNIVLDKTNIPLKEPEFTFSSVNSVNFFNAVNGDVYYDQGALVYDSNDLSSLISGLINVPKGHRYSALLEIRNTILMRIKNESSATKIKISFITSNDMQYDEKKSKVFDLDNSNTYQPYYFNLSDNKYANGYLRGIKIEMTGGTGKIYIDSIQFEREKAIYDYAGEILSCLSNGDTVTIKGKVKSNYVGKKISLYETNIINYKNSVDGLNPVAVITPDKADFEIKIPFINGEMTRLSSHFIAVTENTLIADKFSIENYKDFTDNPYAFTLPDFQVRVTNPPFNARGDHFTDDTDAIQAAINYVSEHGGGSVVIPGNTSIPEGKRYIITNLVMKSHVDLHIEKGATLWQSPNESDYNYEAAFGHDVSIPGINWTHAALCHNLPLILISGVDHVRISGGGSIRGIDFGGENIDGVDGSTIWTGCSYKIHVIPLGIYDSEYLDISDIELIRTNVYHIAAYASRYIYFGNMKLHEVTCASGDGFGLGIGTKDVLIDRCFLTSNDDGVVLCSSYNDPRGLKWWFAKPGKDNSIRNITVLHSCISGGHGITFITWGTDAPDLSLQEISEIEVHDNILSGGWSVGTWCDNPYYGESPFDNLETDDYSPVKNVRITKNRHLAKADLLSVQATNIITDCGIHSASDFQHGDFERVKGENGWVAGLSNWTAEKNASENSVGTVKNGGGYCGYIGDLDKGNAKLYQGLYLKRGTHTVKADVKTSGITAKLFIRSAETNTLIKSVNFSNINFATKEISFETLIAGTYYIGIEGGDANTGSAYIDNASITSESLPYPKFFSCDFEHSNEEFFDKGIWQIINVDDNEVLSAPNGNVLSSVTFNGPYDDFDFRANVAIRESTATIDGNIGFLVHYTDDNNYYFLEYNIVHKFLQVRKFVNGTPTLLANRDNFVLNLNEWYQMGVRSKGRYVEWYINKELVLSYTDNESSFIQSGGFIINAYYASPMFDDVEIANVDTIDFTGEGSNNPTTGESFNLLNLVTLALLSLTTFTLRYRKRKKNNI